jgi:hypothetical protein
VSFDWSKHKSSDNTFVEFNVPGDSFTGTIVGIREHVFDPQKGAVPLLDMQPRNGGEQMTLSASATNLRRQLAEISPQITDELRVTFTEAQKLPGRPQPLKIFEIKHRAGPRNVVETPPPDPPAADDFDDDTAGFSDEPF